MEVLRIVLPVVLMIVIGMVCRKTNLISREGINTLKSLVVNITLPAVMLKAFATTRYTVMDLILPLIMFGICLAGWLLGRIVGRLLKLRSRFVPFLTTGYEAGMLGYALFNMLYGSARVSDFARIDLGQVLFVFTLYKILLGMESSEKTSGSRILKEMIFSPIVIAIAAGVIIGASGLYQALIPSGVSGVFETCVEFVAAPTSAIILLTIGYDLVFGDIPWVETLKIVAVRFVIALALMAVFKAIVGALWPAAGLGIGITVMFILPPPFVLPVFADDPDQRVIVSSVLSLSTVLAIVCFIVLAVMG